MKKLLLLLVERVGKVLLVEQFENVLQLANELAFPC
jgi:hypothetical protein